ncbi:hypothetical protein E8E11_008053 [Didymella keratinophila]|nr:hypothetical protein E8E11_008053 [Didymella keratinophila]
MNPDQQVAEMERIVGYTFKDRQLAVETLFHGGMLIDYDGAWITPSRNERIAIVGDNILDTLLIRKCLTARDGQGNLLSPMQWQKLIHDDLVSNQALDARARDLGLDACVIKDPSTRVVWLRMLATTFEAIIGAVWNTSN